MTVRAALITIVATLLLGTPSTIYGQTREEAVLWTSIQNSTNPDDYRGYLDAYPNGTFAPLARRRLATLLEAKRGDLAGSEWEGKEIFRSGFGGIPKPVSPDDRRAEHFRLVLALTGNGLCQFAGDPPRARSRNYLPRPGTENAPCTWSKTGDTITITIPKGKDICAKDYSLRLGNEGTTLSGTVFRHTGGSCWGGSFIVQMQRIQATPSAPSPAGTVPRPSMGQIVQTQQTQEETRQQHIRAKTIRDVSAGGLAFRLVEGALHRSMNGGKSWDVFVSTNDPITDVAILETSAKTGVFAFAGTLFYSEDGGITWRLISPPLDGCMGCVIRAASLSEVSLVDGDLPVHTTKDGGKTWKRLR